MATGTHSATGEGRADDNEFTLYLTMSVRCAAQIWQDDGDAELAMRVLTRAIYAAPYMPEIFVSDLTMSSTEVGEYVEANPLSPCEQCGGEGIASIDSKVLCWKHYTVAIWQGFTEDQLAKQEQVTTGDDTT